MKSKDRWKKNREERKETEIHRACIHVPDSTRYFTCLGQFRLEMR